MFAKEQLTTTCQQTNGFTLSRPRDFISALKERDSGVGCSLSENSQTSTTPEENPTILLSSESSSQPELLSSEHRYASAGAAVQQVRTQAEDSSLCCCPSNSTSDGRASEACDSPTEEAVSQSRGVDPEASHG